MLFLVRTLTVESMNCIYVSAHWATKMLPTLTLTPTDNLAQHQRTHADAGRRCKQQNNKYYIPTRFSVIPFHPF